MILPLNSGEEYLSGRVGDDTGGLDFFVFNLPGVKST